MNELSNLMLKYWWVAPVVCVIIILAWLNVGMQISGW